MDKTDVKFSLISKGISVAYPPLAEVTTPLVKTAQAAYYLQLQRSTLCSFDKSPTAPLKPIRIGKKFFFKTEDIKRILQVTGARE